MASFQLAGIITNTASNFNRCLAEKKFTACCFRHLMTIQENAFELQFHLQLNTVYIENNFQKYLKHILDFKKDNLHCGSLES